MKAEVKVLLAIADGTEEIEAITALDLLRRAGAEVTVAAAQKSVTLSHGLLVTAEKTLEEAAKENYDLIVLPGGLPGAYNLRDDQFLDTLLRRQVEAKKLVGAICAAPAFILAEKGFLKNFSATCYPGCEEGYSEVNWQTDTPVICDRNFITGRGPGAAYPFALALIEALYGKETKKSLARDTMYL